MSERCGEKVKVTDQAPDIPECLQSSDKLDTTQTQSSRDYPDNNSGLKVGVRNKWGMINQLKSGAINGANKCNLEDRKQPSKALAHRIKRKGKVYKPGEVPPGQLLISSFLKSKQTYKPIP